MRARRRLARMAVVAALAVAVVLSCSSAGAATFTVPAARSPNIKVSVRSAQARIVRNNACLAPAATRGLCR